MRDELLPPAGDSTVYAHQPMRAGGFAIANLVLVVEVLKTVEVRVGRMLVSAPGECRRFWMAL
jgi:hypothetical protein